jgi:hypothetical protein
MEKTKKNARRRTTLHVAAIRQASKVVSIGREIEPYRIGKATGYSADTGDSGRGADTQAGSESVSFFPAGGAGANRESVAHGDGANGGCDGVQVCVSIVPRKGTLMEMAEELAWKKRLKKEEKDRSKGSLVV